MTGLIPTAQTRRRRADLQIVERRPSVTKIFDRWTLTLKDRDVDLVICDGMGGFMYRDRRSSDPTPRPWDDHCLRACELAEDPRAQLWIDAEAEQRRRTTYALRAAIGPRRNRMVSQRQFDDYPDRFDLKVSFRQGDGSVVLADRNWKGKTAGIYMIRSLSPDGGVYVGESSDIINRWLQHQSQLKAGLHHNRRLQSNWDTHASGIDGVYGFEWVVLEILPEDQVSREERGVIEGRWIDAMKTAGPTLNVL